MAERVQFRLEETLEELEQMERVGLFNRQELKSIIKKRQKLEYKIQRKRKFKDDFLKYIEYEINLLDLVKKRRKQIGYNFKKNEIDYPIIRRICQLFRDVQYRHQYNVELWLNHIAFCKKMNMRDAVSKIYIRMLQVHSDKVELWLQAVKWEMELNNAPETARNLIQRAIRFHPNCKAIFHEWFRLELQYANIIRKRRQVLGVSHLKDDEVSDEVLNGAVAVAVYKHAVEKIEDAQFHLKFATICQKFLFAHDIEEKILTEAEEKYSNNEYMWNYIAKRTLTKCEKSSVEKNFSAKSSAQNLRKFFDVYKTAITKINTNKMYELYINACISKMKKLIYRDHKFLCKSFAIEAFSEAGKKDFLSEKQFIKWLSISPTDDRGPILKMALEKYRNSTALWHMHILQEIEKEPPVKEIQRLFNSAVENVAPEDSTQLWKLATDWALTFSQEKAINLLKKSLDIHEPHVTKETKTIYLEIVALAVGVNAAREVYKDLSKNPPITEEFFWKMFEIENAQPEPDIKHLRRILEDIITYFGTSNTNVWLKYLQLEKEHKDGKADAIPAIHWRAVKTLVPELQSQYITAHTLIIVGKA